MDRHTKPEFGVPPDPFPRPPRNVRRHWLYALRLWCKRVASIPSIPLLVLYNLGFFATLLRRAGLLSISKEGILWVPFMDYPLLIQFAIMAFCSILCFG
jgi:hypothetical protein